MTNNRTSLEVGRRLFPAFALAALTMPFATGAQSTAAKPEFEVASVKPCRPGESEPGGRRGGSADNPPTGTLHMPCIPLGVLIQGAYVDFAEGRFHPRTAVRPDGAPAWIDSERYSIDAKTMIAQSQGMMRGPMMQRLLEDRFKLKIRREIREAPVYALTVAKGGPKLQPAKEGSCIVADFDHPPRRAPGQPLGEFCGMWRVGSDGMNMFGVTMAEFCTFFTDVLDRNAIDKTGIAGRFDIHLDILPDDLGMRPRGSPGSPQPSPQSSAPSDDPADPVGTAVFAAVQKLGLKLVPAKGPREFLVIDHVERPSEN
jgi:uncharacterized protein (TIGR03435 family)